MPTIAPAKSYMLANPTPKVSAAQVSALASELHAALWDATNARRSAANKLLVYKLMDPGANYSVTLARFYLHGAMISTVLDELTDYVLAQVSQESDGQIVVAYEVADGEKANLIRLAAWSEWASSEGHGSPEGPAQRMPSAPGCCGEATEPRGLFRKAGVLRRGRLKAALPTLQVPGAGRPSRYALAAGDARCYGRRGAGDRDGEGRA